MRRLRDASLIALASVSATLALAATGAVERLELLTLDARYALGVARRPAGDDVVIAWIDQESMDYMAAAGAPFPWPREVYGQVLQHLRQAGAKAVAFDVLFDQPANADDDRAFAEVLGAADDDVLAMKFVERRSVPPPPEQEELLAARALPGAATERERPPEAGFVLPQAPFAAASRLGFVNITGDADRTFRRYDLLRSWGRHGASPGAHPSLALALALVGREGMPAAATRGARMLLNFRGPGLSFQNVKFVNMLESINRVEQGQAPLYAPETFRGKYVLVGIHADGYEDNHETPLDAHFPGVELHATALDNLLRDDALVAPEWNLPLAAAAAAVATATVFVLPGAALPALALLALAAAAAAASLWAWTALVAVPVAAPALGGALASGGAFLYRIVVEGRQKRAMHRAFQSYLAPEVLREVLRAGDALRLGGELRDVTMFFTDLQGFTGLSERLAPHELVAFLNDYFTRMCAPVLAERGVIDKFIGDAIMAFFGAPIAEPGHGARAVRAALAALRTSTAIADELRRRGMPTIATRIGVHRGQAVIGNMGSAQRFDYTAIGDTVNLAARLEGANKAFGTDCLVSEAAWRDCGDAVLGREVGRVRVVGREAPIVVWTPLVERERATDDDRAFVAEWRRGVDALRSGDRATAKAAIAAAARARPDDRLARTWLDRLDDPAFDGSFHLDTK